MEQMAVATSDEGAETPKQRSPVEDRQSPGSSSRRRVLLVIVVGLAGVTATVGALTVRGVWGVYRPPADDIPDAADAVVVFAGEGRRTELALQLMDDRVADVLVLSLGERDRVGRSLCGQTEPFEVLCPTPETVDTRGEARMLGELARQRSWNSLVAVTGDYHAQRARTRLSRCFHGNIASVNVDWGRPRLDLVRRETLGYLEAQLLERSC